MVRLLAVPVVVSVVVSAQPAPTLPDHDAFVQETRNNLAKSQREQYRFSYKERRTELQTNPFGRIGSGGMVVYDVTPADGGNVIVRRLIERDGKPVADGPVQKTDLTQRAERRSRKSGLEDSVEMLEFALARRETVRGRNTIVVTFKPKPNARPETSEGKIAKLFTGSAWVDEERREVMRIEATAIDDITIGLGLVARLDEGTKATLTRDPIDGSIWLPTSIRFVGQGRALLVRRLNIDQRIEWFDYKRMN
jgi:hypothetical protein